MTETPSERLKEWYVNFIKIFNEEYVKLSDEERKHFPTAHNYSSRCQIEVFWLKRPEWQLTITTHFQDRPDGEIIINGPYDSSNFLDEVEKIIQQERWNRTIDYDSAYHSIREIPHLYNELLARQLHSFIERAKNALFSRGVEHTGVTQGQRPGQKQQGNRPQQGQLSEEVRILLEAVTHQKDSEFAQAFFMGWVIIERHISQIWYDKIHNKRIMDHERVNKLQNPGAWSIDYLIEVLNLEDDIEQMDYDVYMDLKRKRNHLMHSGKQIRPDDAERCVNVASEIIRKKISKLNNIS